ncbi:MAG: glycosyltransferase family 4 protein [Wenzhouxiangella sp.]
MLAIVVTWSLTPFLRRYLVAHGIVDRPDLRRSHAVTTPRGGGISIAAALLCVLVLLWPSYTEAPALAALVLGLAGLGWLDDRFCLAVRWRLLIQAGIALSLLVWLGGLEAIAIGHFVVHQPWLWSALALVAVIWLINLHNFMDGSDGLASVQGIWCGLMFGSLFAWSGHSFPAIVAFSLAAACLGFLHWNRPTARIFMGDTGSILLGGIVAWLALLGAVSGSISVWQSLMICSLFVVDATATLLARLARGERWYTPHRQHAYQRLIDSGWSHGRVLVLYGLLKGLVVLPFVLAGWYLVGWDVWLAAGLIALLAAGWWRVQSAFTGEYTTHG